MLDLFAQLHSDDAQLLQEIGQRHPQSYTDLWEQLTARDIERLITEKVHEILVIPADLGWSDIGSWSIVHDILKEQLGVEMVVKAEHIDAGSRDCLIMSDDRLVATAGLSNVVIVDTPDALLVINKDAAQDVKLLVDELKARNSSLL